MEGEYFEEENDGITKALPEEGKTTETNNRVEIVRYFMSITAARIDTRGCERRLKKLPNPARSIFGRLLV